jgi:hypothetical protein
LLRNEIEKKSKTKYIAIKSLKIKFDIINKIYKVFSVQNKILENIFYWLIFLLINKYKKIKN